MMGKSHPSSSMCASNSRLMGSNRIPEASSSLQKKHTSHSTINSCTISSAHNTENISGARARQSDSSPACSRGREKDGRASLNTQKLKQLPLKKIENVYLLKKPPHFSSQWEQVALQCGEFSPLDLPHASDVGNKATQQRTSHFQALNICVPQWTTKGNRNTNIEFIFETQDPNTQCSLESERERERKNGRTASQDRVKRGEIVRH